MLGLNSSFSTGNLAFRISPQNTTVHGLSQLPVIPGTMFVTTCCRSQSRLVCRMSLLPTVTKTFQYQAPSGIKSSVKRTYATCLRIPTAIGRMPLKDHGERYYISTRKIVSIRVYQNQCFPISSISATTPAMQLQWTSLSLTFKRHRLSCSEKPIILAISSCMTSMIPSNTLSSPSGRIQITRRRTSKKMENTSAFPVTLPKSTATMS